MAVPRIINLSKASAAKTATALRSETSNDSLGSSVQGPLSAVSSTTTLDGGASPGSVVAAHDAPHDASAATDAPMSKMRRLLLKRAATGTLHRRPLLKGTLRVVGAFIKKVSSDYTWVKVARKTVLPMPVPHTTKITQVTIPFRDDMILDGMTAADAQGEGLEAEWIDSVPHKDKNSPAERVILFLHGGAYVLGSRLTHRILTWRLSKYANARVLAVDYRLAPEHTFPIAVYDAICAYRYLIDPPAGSGLPKYKPEQISFCGDSAGGGLATALMLYCRDSDKIPLPGAVGTFSPWIDLSQSFPAWHLNERFDYLPGGTEDTRYMNAARAQPYIKSNDDLYNPLVSPVMAVENPSKPLPPMLIQVGDAERVRDDSIVFSQSTFPTSPIRLEIYQDQVHVFQFFSGIEPTAKFALKRMGQFIQEQTGSSIGKRPELPRQALHIHTSAGHPMEEVSDAMGIIDDGARLLIEQGVWTNNMETTSLAFENARRIAERAAQGKSGAATGGQTGSTGHGQ